MTEQAKDLIEQYEKTALMKPKNSKGKWFSKLCAINDLSNTIKALEEAKGYSVDMASINKYKSLKREIENGQ